MFIGVGSNVDAPMEVPGEDLAGRVQSDRISCTQQCGYGTSPERMALATRDREKGGGHWWR